MLEDLLCPATLLSGCQTVDLSPKFTGVDGELPCPTTG